MLDGSNFMRFSWVNNLKLHQFKVSDGWNFLIMGKVSHKCRQTTDVIINQKVKHSQRMSANSLLPWVIVTQQGQVLAAHCTCMAGYVYSQYLSLFNNYTNYEALVRPALIFQRFYHV